MFRFQHETYLYALFIIPVLVIAFVMYRRWVKKRSALFAADQTLNMIAPTRSTIRAWVRFILFVLGMTMLIIAIANPQTGGRLTEVKVEGIDMMIALDVSNSMNAEDIAPTRLERSKQAISQLIDKLRNDRIGMIVFAGDAYVQLPITSDYSAAKMFLSSISTDMVQSQGTDVEAAIKLAEKSFETTKSKKKVLVIITDGESHESDPVSEAKKASDAGIVIHTIGMGSEGGAPIPEYYNGQKIYKKDPQGNTVITKLNEEILTKLAEAGNGMYVRASNSEAGLNTIFKQIQGMEKEKLGSKVYTDFDSKYQPFLALAIVLFVIQIVLPERKSSWWDKLNLFGEK
jgi:Ca-activated chloride channel homolog